MKQVLLGLLLGATLAACEGPAGLHSTRQALAGLSDGTYNGRNYKLYVPSGYVGTPIPLVLMLHGCSQTPADFVAGTQMNALADSETFFVLYPEQSSAKNAGQCWNWFLASNQARGAGEPAELVGLLDHVALDHEVDTARTYVAGLSAGGAMAVILGATYPDRFPAITVAAGLEYKAATTVNNALSAMTSGGPSPNLAGSAAKTAMGSAARPVRVLVIHGSADQTVAPINADQVVSQWAQTNDLASDGNDDDNVDDVADATDSVSVTGGHAATRTSFKDSTSGRVLMQKIVVSGMDHAWSGGSVAGSYTDPAGPDATALSWAFFAETTVLPDAGVDLAHAATDAADTATDGAAAAPLDGSSAPPAPMGTAGCEVTGGGRAPGWLGVLAVLAWFGIFRRRAASGG